MAPILDAPLLDVWIALSQLERLPPGTQSTARLAEDGSVELLNEEGEICVRMSRATYSMIAEKAREVGTPKALEMAEEMERYIPTERTDD